MNKKIITFLIIFGLIASFFLPLISIDRAEAVSPYRYVAVHGYFGYWQNGDGSWWFQPYNSPSPQSLGPDPTGVTVMTLCTPYYVPNYEEVTNVYYYGQDWDKPDSLLEPRPPSNLEKMHSVQNITAYVDFIGASGQEIMPTLRLKLSGPGGAEDAGNGAYKEYFTIIYEFTNPELLNEIDANLQMTLPNSIQWDYIEYLNNEPRAGFINLDGTNSTAGLDISSYEFEIFAGKQSDTIINSNGICNTYFNFRPDDTMGYSNIVVTSLLTVTNINGNTDTATATGNIPIQITNAAPTANFRLNPSDYFYATRPISITDRSNDPEGDMASTNWTITTSTGNTVFMAFFSGDEKEPYFMHYNDSYLEVSDFNNNGGNITFLQKGNYEIKQEVTDRRTYSSKVSSKSDTYSKNIFVNSAPEPPVANFDVLEFGYPNEPLSVTDRSTDPNDDIISWTWTKPPKASGNLNNSGGTLTFPEEGKYNLTLKVTDRTGLSDQITKAIEIIPPLPMPVLNVDGTLKENRKVIIDSNESISPRVDPIQTNRNEWSYEPLDGQNPTSIKIDTVTSTHTEKQLLFKEPGRYKIKLKSHNNFSDSNPNHEHIAATESELIIKIEPDLKPEPNFNLIVPTPNFVDNPEKATVQIIDTSSSPDGDILDRYSYEIRRDDNENNNFDDESVYHTSTAKNYSFDVVFEEGNQGKFQTKLTIKEEFGQPTIGKFVTAADRRENSIEKTFAINWIPYIDFEGLEDWAYTDDTLTLKTNLKDEEISSLTVNWKLQKANKTTMNLENVNIDTYCEKLLDNNGGLIRFKESGYYKLTATVTDNKGLSSQYSEEIRIYPLPTAVLKDNPSYRWQGKAWTTKENRRFDFDGNSSFATDYYTPLPSPLHPIDHSKDYWEIIPLDGQNANQVIKIRNGSGGALVNQGTNSLFKVSNNALDEQMLFKEKGRYKLRYQVTNTHGKKSPFVEEIITVAEDTPPITSFKVISPTYRDKDDSKRAELLSYELTFSSDDSDTLGSRRVRYRFDSNNDGNFTGETWVNVPIDASNPNNVRAVFKATHVGRYQIEYMAKDKFNQPTIDEFVTAADRRETYKYQVIEVDNIRPTVDFKVVPSNKVDIVFTVGQIESSKTQELNAKIEQYVKAKLESNNTDYIDSNIQMIETATISTDEQGAEAILGDWRSVQIPQDFSGSFSNISGGWQIANNQLYATSGYRPARGYINPSPEAYKTTDADINFTWGIRSDASSFSHGEAGFMFRIKDDRNYYVYIMDNHDACGNVRYNYREVLVKVTNGSRQIINTNSFPSFTRGQKHDFNIKLEGNNIKIYRDGSLRFDYTDNNNPHDKGSYGFYVWDQYGAYFSGIGVTSQSTKSLDEVLKEPNWRDEATRFVINLSDVPLEELNPSSPKYPVVVARMLNDQLYFAQLGTSSSRSQTLEFIKDIDNRGTFIYNNNPNMDKALQDLGDYILNTLRSIAKPSSKYVLLNEDVNYETFYTDYENDPKMANTDNWMYEHNQYYFDNSLGKVDYHNIWLTESKNKFDKVGHFQVSYRVKDNPVGSDNRFDEYRKWSEMLNGKLDLYVHRKPVAQFKANITKSGSTFNISYTDTSYDLDHTSRADKGIVAREWSWKEVGANTWNSGKLTSGSTTKEYLVKLRVRDMDGENNLGVWSDDEIVLITNNPMPPIAQFSLSQSTIPLGTALSVTDSSYDPNGDPIVEWRWKLTKTSGSGTGSWNFNYGSSFNINTFKNSLNSRINAQGIGDYRLELQVRDNTGSWGDVKATSEIFTQTFKVIPVNNAPIANFNPLPNPIFVDNQNINWNVSASDPDGHSLSRLWTLERYEVPNISNISSNTPTNIYTYTSNTPFSGTFKGNSRPWGAYKITLAVTDNPPVPPYQPEDRKTTYVTKNLYVIPEISLLASYDHPGGEILVGDTITLRAVTSKEVTKVTCEFNGTTLNLVNTSSDSYSKTWTLPFVIPETVLDSGTYILKFTASTNYGGNGSITRSVTQNVNIDIIALKLINFRISNIINHPHLSYPISKDNCPVNYKTGYYATFQINAKGNPSSVKAEISVDGSLDKTVSLTNVGTSGNETIWEGRYYSASSLPNGSIIRANLTAYKGSLEYNYNSKETWDGRILIVNGTALQDSIINRTN